MKTNILIFFMLFYHSMVYAQNVNKQMDEAVSQALSRGKGGVKFYEAIVSGNKPITEKDFAKWRNENNQYIIDKYETSKIMFAGYQFDAVKKFYFLTIQDYNYMVNQEKLARERQLEQEKQARIQAQQREQARIEALGKLCYFFDPVSAKNQLVRWTGGTFADANSTLLATGNGEARLSSNENLLYKGNVENGYPNGLGELYNPDSKTLIYKGDWKNGKKWGNGLHYTNNSIFKGTFYNDLFWEGYGETNIKNHIFKCPYKNGKMNGEGTEEYSKDNGYIFFLGTPIQDIWSTQYSLKFTGTFRDGKKNGNGVLIEYYTDYCPRGGFWSMNISTHIVQREYYVKTVGVWENDQLVRETEPSSSTTTYQKPCPSTETSSSSSSSSTASSDAVTEVNILGKVKKVEERGEQSCDLCRNKKCDCYKFYFIDGTEGILYKCRETGNWVCGDFFCVETYSTKAKALYELWKDKH